MSRFIALLCCVVLLAGCAAAFAPGSAKPEVIKKVAPKYTPEAKAAGIQGVVKLDVEIDAEGHAVSVTVVKGVDPGLDRSAVEAVKQWEWAPTIKDGKPIPVKTDVQVNFSLQR